MPPEQILHLEKKNGVRVDPMVQNIIISDLSAQAASNNSNIDTI